MQTKASTILVNVGQTEYPNWWENPTLLFQILKRLESGY
jgi:hypothetical protein